MYKTPQEWKDYFNGQTGETNKLLVDLLDAIGTGGIGGGGSAYIDRSLLFEIISPSSIDDVQDYMNERIDEIKSLGFKVVNVNLDMEFNNDNQQRYYGAIYFQYPAGAPHIIVETPWSFSCGNEGQALTNEYRAIDFTGQTISTQINVDGAWVEVDSHVICGFLHVKNTAEFAPAYPVGTYDLRMIDLATDTVYYSQAAVEIPSCV